MLQYLAPIVGGSQSGESPEEIFLFDPISVVGFASVLESMDYKIGLLPHKITLDGPGSGVKRCRRGDSRERSAKYIKPAIFSALIIYPPPIEGSAIRKIYVRLVAALRRHFDMYNLENEKNGLPTLKRTDKIVKIYNKIIRKVSAALDSPLGDRTALQHSAYDKRLCEKIQKKNIWQPTELKELDQILQKLFESDSQEQKEEYIAILKKRRDQKLELFVPAMQEFFDEKKVSDSEIRTVTKLPQEEKRKKPDLVENVRKMIVRQTLLDESDEESAELIDDDFHLVDNSPCRIIEDEFGDEWNAIDSN